MKKVLLLSIVFILMIIPVINAVSFSDVSSDGWEYKYVTELSDKGVINGYPDGRFNPKGTLTKGEFLKLIITASINDLKIDEVEKPFDHWAAGYVSLAENYGVLEKSKVTIDNINEPINRIEMSEILGKCDIKIKERTQELGIADFIDVDEITDIQYTMLAHNVEMGYITGYPEGTFMPNKTLSRAEAATIIWRFTQAK
jgi:hypothetical protein